MSDPIFAAGSTPVFAPVFDGHNDLLSRLWDAGDSAGRSFFDGRAGDISLDHCRAGAWRAGSLPSGCRARPPMPPTRAPCTAPFRPSAWTRRIG